jgi:hypothetical protein
MLRTEAVLASIARTGANSMALFFGPGGAAHGFGACRKPLRTASATPADLASNPSW